MKGNVILLILSTLKIKCINPTYACEVIFSFYYYYILIDGINPNDLKKTENTSLHRQAFADTTWQLPQVWG